MSLLLRLSIRLYWRLRPEDTRRSCIYRETCSRYVYRVTHTMGFIAGARALLERLRGCRPGYSVCPHDGKLHLRLADGSVLDESGVALHILAPYQRSAELLRQRLSLGEGM